MATTLDEFKLVLRVLNLLHEDSKVIEAKYIIQREIQLREFNPRDNSESK